MWREKMASIFVLSWKKAIETLEFYSWDFFASQCHSNLYASADYLSKNEHQLMSTAQYIVDVIKFV